ncbi:MAG: hypothetical protein AMJ69_06325 [Gammaproteobacteria bacterium SG8_47]|nr:MAG: hypothetical protein AMJ69_06325 [Gammaproteobacteria bacterium SG8_47]
MSGTFRTSLVSLRSSRSSPSPSAPATPLRSCWRNPCHCRRRNEDWSHTSPTTVASPAAPFSLLV